MKTSAKDQREFAYLVIFALVTHEFLSKLRKSTKKWQRIDLVLQGKGGAVVQATLQGH